MAQEFIEDLGQLIEFLSEDARFSDYQIEAVDDGLVELTLPQGTLTIADSRLLAERERLEPYLERSAAVASTLLLMVGPDAAFEGAWELRQRADLVLIALPSSRDRIAIGVSNLAAYVAMRSQSAERGRWMERYRYEVGEFIGLARAIASERDIHRLLGLILEKSRFITGADAGSVYIVEGRSLSDSERTLRFMVSQNDSMHIDFREFSLPVDERSIVGRTVLAREIISIPDLYELDQSGKNPWGFQHDKKFDHKTGYEGRSMLTVPMINQKDEVIGVIQLINRKREGAPALLNHDDFERYVIPFDQRSEELSSTLASQAGISLENTLLYEEIRHLFDGFVNASVTAIESRDPSTSGHSYRVAKLTVGLAVEVDRASDGPYRAVTFSADNLKEIEYAGLLHDFGKVGVREKVLVKAKKLYDTDHQVVLARFDLIRRTVESELLKKKLELIMREGIAQAERHFTALDEELRRKLSELDDFVAFIQRANEPTVLAEGSFERLAEIARTTFVDPRGERRPYLTDDEVAALKLPRGSLTTDERIEIESHVMHTYNFLENIPWGRRLGGIPAIAGSHHEKLDGTGYPRGLKAHEIRVESKMMAIADIFDALTSSDRPYKRAVPVEKALDILGSEVKSGKCDSDLFDIFVEAKVWRRVIGQ